MQLIHQPSLQILADGGSTSSDANILALGRREGLFQSGLDTIVDEAETGASFHLEARMLVMAEYKDRMVKGWIRTPPAFPVLVRPGAALRAEHVATHDGGADVVEGMDEEFVVEALGTTPLTGHLCEELGGKGPLHQAQAVLTEGRVERLALGGGESVQRDGDTTGDELRHSGSLTVQS